MESTDKVAQAAMKHYEALKRAQAAYYERKHPVETRRPRGRPRKVAAEGGSAEGGGSAKGLSENSSI